MIEERKKYDFDRVVRIVFVVACVAGTVFLINYLSSVLLPFFVACLLAYMIHPLVKFNKRWMHCKNNIAPVCLTLVMLLLIAYGAFAIIVPYIYQEISTMVEMLTQYTTQKININGLPATILEFVRNHVDIKQLVDILSKEQWMDLFSDIFQKTWNFVGATANVIVNIFSWFIAILYLIFILIDYDKVAYGMHKAVPERYKDGVFMVVNDVKRGMNMYFRGQSLIALIVGIMFSIGFSIIGLPMAVAFGLFIGVLNLVPYLQLISLPLAAFLCIVDAAATGTNFWVICGYTTLVYCVVQIIQDMFLTPKIMGKFMAINPVLILLSLSVWGSLLGFVGLIIALPLTSLLISYYKRYVLNISSDAQNSTENTTTNITDSEQ